MTIYGLYQWDEKNIIGQTYYFAIVMKKAKYLLQDLIKKEIKFTPRQILKIAD